MSKLEITQSDLEIFNELVEEFYYQHPQLNNVEYDESGIPFEYKDGTITYESYGAKKTYQIHQLSSKLKSLM